MATTWRRGSGFQCGQPDSYNCGGSQVYKAVRAGVQDVAVKFLHRTNAEDLQKFIEVRSPQSFPALTKL